MNPYIMSSLINKLRGKPEYNPGLTQRETDYMNPDMPQIDESLYQPGPGMERFSQFVQNTPQREDYQLGKGKNILAILAGMLTGATSGAGQGINLIQSLRERPYREPYRIIMQLNLMEM